MRALHIHTCIHTCMPSALHKYIAATEAKALGVMVSSKGIYPVPEDIDAITRMPHPTTRTEVKTFLGTSGFYRQFIPDFATISAPLAALSAGIDRFSWSEHHDLAFELLKVSLSTKPVLALPILSQPFRIYTDFMLGGCS